MLTIHNLCTDHALIFKPWWNGSAGGRLCRRRSPQRSRSGPWSCSGTPGAAEPAPSWPAAWSWPARRPAGSPCARRTAAAAAAHRSPWQKRADTINACRSLTLGTKDSYWPLGDPLEAGLELLLHDVLSVPAQDSCQQLEQKRALGQFQGIQQLKKKSKQWIRWL